MQACSRTLPGIGFLATVACAVHGGTSGGGHQPSGDPRAKVAVFISDTKIKTKDVSSSSSVSRCSGTRV